MEGSSVDVVEDEVVEADVEGLGDASEGVEAGGDAAVLVAADLSAVAADVFGEPEGPWVGMTFILSQS